MFKKIVCITLVACCVMSSSNLFAMESKRVELSTDARLQALQAQVAEIRQRNAGNKQAIRADQNRLPVPVVQAHELPDAAPAHVVQAPAVPVQASPAAPVHVVPAPVVPASAVQPDAKRVFWIIAGGVCAQQIWLSLHDSEEFGLKKNLFLSLCSYAIYRGARALKNICQADIKPAWDSFKSWF